MSHHPGLGYVDVPPLVPWVTLIPRLLTGNALWALRVISALVCAMIILLTGLMARLLGGAGWVQGLAALPPPPHHRCGACRRVGKAGTKIIDSQGL